MAWARQPAVDEVLHMSAAIGQGKLPPPTRDESRYYKPSGAKPTGAVAGGGAEGVSFRRHTEEIMKKIVVCLLLLVADGGFGATSDTSKRNELTESNLLRLEADLNDPTKRLAAIAQLSKFGSVKLYRVGSVSTIIPDPIQDKLCQRAADLARTHTDAETVRLALESSDPRLHLWGICFWRVGMFGAVKAAGRSPLRLPAEGRTDEEKKWAALLPLLKKHAAGGDYSGLAIDALWSFPREEFQEFFLSLIAKETEPMLLLQLIKYTEPPIYQDPILRARHPPKIDERFSKELLRLLADANPKIRQSALDMIGGNWQRPEMWQVRFMPEIAQRVAEFRNSDDPKDRRLAEWAQHGLQKSAAIWAERDAAKSSKVRNQR